MLGSGRQAVTKEYGIRWVRTDGESRTSWYDSKRYRDKQARALLRSMLTLSVTKLERNKKEL